MKRTLVLMLLIFGIMFISSNVAYGAISWNQIWGPVGTVVGYHDVIKGTSVIYATELSTGDIFRYDGAPFKWTKVGGPGKMFAVSGKGDLYGLPPNGQGVFQYAERGTGHRSGDLPQAFTPGEINFMQLIPRQETLPNIMELL